MHRAPLGFSFSLACRVGVQHAHTSLTDFEIVRDSLAATCSRGLAKLLGTA